MLDDKGHRPNWCIHYRSPLAVVIENDPSQPEACDLGLPGLQDRYAACLHGGKSACTGEVHNYGLLSVDRVAALFVDPHGVYDIAGVDAWGLERDARKYNGPHPVIAHPPCKRWGKYWHGSPRKPHVFELGDDDGCFAAALVAVKTFGGVLEHPAYSHAWQRFQLPQPNIGGGWHQDLVFEGASCYVEQAHYGHFARKATWLYVCHVYDLPDLIWGAAEQRLPAYAVARYGRKKASRSGMIASVGSKDKTKIRESTPPAFRDILVSIAASVQKL